MKRSVLTAVFALGSLLEASAQSDPGITLTPGAEDSWSVSWQADTGWTYFLQHSRDLQTWRNFPVIEIGQNEEVAWGFTVEEDPFLLQPEPFFLRLKFTSLTFTNVELDDTDGDTIANWAEVFLLGTDPLSDDTDGDGTTDQLEDADGDGLFDVEEALWGFGHLFDADSDGDGLSDAEELVLGTNPFDEDTDGDGLTDDNDALPLVSDSVLDHTTLGATGSPQIDILSPEVTLLP